MLVNAHEVPKKVEYTQGKKLVSFNVKEVDKDGEIHYEFHRLKLPVDTDSATTTMLVNKEKTKIVDAEIKALAQDYSESEKGTFWIQEQEAKNYRAGIDDVSFITKLANTRGITVDELVTKIEGNSTALREATAVMLGKYQASLSEVFE